MNSLVSRLSGLDAHHRLLVSLGTAALSFLLVPSMENWTRLTVVWVVFALTALSLMWLTIVLAHPRDLPRLSGMQDSSRLLILVLVVAAAIAGIVSAVTLLKNKSSDAYIPLSILAVGSAWTLVHTVFTLRYAHLYYGNDPHRRPGGLDFPNDSEPDYLDFAYFSFVIGMTSQVSDVAVASKAMRRTALAHGILSFLFNAIIIALTISGLSSML